MPLILTLLENEICMQVLCKSMAQLSRSPRPTFNGCQIVDESIADSLKNIFWKV